jgi:integrase
MRVAITDTAINKAKRDAARDRKRRELSDAGEKRADGLRLRVTPAGSASWVLGCRDREGRIRRFPLGSWPGVGLSEARDAARTLRERVRAAGADPIAERRRERAIGQDARAGIGTLASLLDLYERQECGALKSWPESRKRIAVVFKPLMSRPVATMTLGDLQLTADGYTSERTGRVSPKSAAFAVRTLRPVLKWAAHTGRGYVSEELARISTPGDVKPRKRILSRDELATLLPTLHASNRPYAAALHFMLLTITRRQEVAMARWRDVDMIARTWIIRETKNGQPHTVPLSRQAMELLQSRLPVSGQGEPNTPDRDALIFATSTGARLLNWDRETKAQQGASGTKDWTRHDLRRTGATMLGEMGEMPDIIEAALNHAVIHSALAATYNRSRYRPQVASALQRLADALEGIEAGAANVQPLRLVVG